MGFRILSAEISHETNTFNIYPTDIRAFQKRYYLQGPEAIERRGDTNTELAGLLDVGRDHDWSLTHVLSAAAGPGGRVTRAAFDTLVDPVVEAARQGGWDGIFLILHGAMVTDFDEDGEGTILRRIRAVTGPALPIAVTLDPHANVTAEMCDLAQILVSFTTYPHVDIRTTGQRAAELLHRAMNGEISPRTIRAHRPMLEEASGGRTDRGPMIERHALARAYETRKDIFAISINAAFPEADIAEVGPTVLVTGEGDPAPHRAIAEEIAEDIWVRRDETLNEYLSVKEAAAIAAGWRAADGPLVIADYADNPGAGSYGDSTNLLAALIEAGITEACFGPLVDKHAVAALGHVPVGGSVALEIGGRTAPDFGGGPVLVEGTLVWHGNGRVIGDGPILGGLERDFGPTAVLRVGGIDILIVTIAQQIMDLQQFLTFGIDPSRLKVVALKSMQHFRAAFAPIAGRIIVCDSGALCTLRYELLDYQNVQRPIFPLDRD